MSAKCTVAGCGEWSFQGGFCREHVEAAAAALASAPTQPSPPPTTLPLTSPAPSGGREGEGSHPAQKYFEHLIHACVSPRCERGWPQDAHDCISATCWVIQQAESFSHELACSILRQRLQRPPRTMFMQWRGEVSRASVLLRVRCGQDILVACRLASSRYAHAATSLLWAHSIIARLHFHHRRRMLETLVGVKESVVHNGYAYRSLARHNPHSQEIIISIYSRDYSVQFYSVDPPWELCPDTCEARHVCATYPWATRALVFADGSACWTKNSTPHNCSYTKMSPGKSWYIPSRTYLHQKEGKYGAVVDWEEQVDFGMASGPTAGRTELVTYMAEADVLLRRRLPY
jgi:hypothetical protein